MIEAVKPVQPGLPVSQQGWQKGTGVLLLHSESRNSFQPPEISLASYFFFLKAENAVLGSLFLILKGKGS